VLKDDGWETHGLEPGPRQREFAGRNHHIIEEPPTEPAYGLIVINHVIEHLRDPLTTLRQIAAATLPGGYVFVSVPDLGRLGEHGKWNYVKSERHICSYTRDSLGSLLGLAGFRPVDGLDAAQWDAIGPEEKWRLKVLARLAEAPVEPSGAPLDGALEALRAYSHRAEEFGAQKKRDATAKQPKEARAKLPTERRAILDRVRLRLR
jgi:SAM-dependent methyltransferase